MNVYEIAEFLNTKATDEQFAELFALLERAMFGRGVPKEYDTETIILNMDVNAVCKRMRNMLINIQREIEENGVD